MTARPFDLVTEALRIQGYIEHVTDKISCRCPAHDDANPSLSVREGRNGSVLIKCFAHCPREAVARALGLDPNNIFSANGHGRRQSYSTEEIKVRCSSPYPTPYVDETGAALLIVARFDVPGEKKKFVQFRPDGSGRWFKGLDGVDRRPLFRLPAVLAAVEAGETIHVVEGERCAAAMDSIGILATTNPGGSGHWSPEHTETLARAARIVVWPDNDETGRKHGYAVADGLVHAGVKDVRVVELEGPRGYDIADFLTEREGDLETAKAELLEMAKEAKPHVPAEPKAEKDERPAVQLTTRIDEVTNATIKALVANPGSSLYWRGQSLVRVTREASKPSSSILRAEGTPAIAPVRPETMVEIISASARVESYSEKFGWRPVAPPITLARTVLERSEWPGVRPLVSVTESPAVRPDGSIALGPGYDSSTGILVLPSVPFPDVTGAVAESCLGAVTELSMPFSEYPFADNRTDLAATVALVMTIACRSAIPGVVPMFPITSTTPRSGKGKLARAAAIIGTGRPPVLMVEKRSGEEWDKTLATCAYEGTPVLLLDNLGLVLRSGELAAAITSTEYYARKLGVNSKIGGPWNTVVVATGNNLTVGGDLAYRCVPIRIEPKTENPDQTDFKFDPVDLATRERPRLFMLAVRIFEAYMAAGMPRQQVDRKMGGFEEWDRRIRHCILWTGLGDPLEGRERLIDESDADLETARIVLAAWREAFPDAATVADALRIAEAAKDGGSPFRDAITLLAAKGAALPSPRYLGAFLRRYRDRIVCGMKLTAVGTLHHATLWAVEGGASS